LIIPLDYFRDVNLIFIKECFMNDGTSASRGGRGFIKWVLILIFLVGIGLTVYNLIIKKKNGLDAVPFGHRAAQLLVLAIARVRGSTTVTTPRSTRFPYNNMNEEEFESQFKIE
jgi:hypothetical protein